MNVSAIDLNLLVALDVLVAERNVTRAGRRIGLSQPAMSNALRRLRQLLDDPVLVRSSQGMIPTPRAMELIVPVRAALAQVERVLVSEKRFEPSASTQVFRVTAMDHAFVTLIPELVTRLVATAPGTRMDLHPYSETTAAQLEAGTIDAAIVVGGTHGRGRGFRRSELYDDNFDCLVRREHPVVKRRLTLRQYVELGHVLASPHTRRGTMVDRALQQKGLSRKVHVIVPHFSAAPFIVARTDLVTTLPRGVARPFAKLLDLRVHRPPIEFDSGPWYLVWHERTMQDPGHTWFRDRVQEVALPLRGSM